MFLRIAGVNLDLILLQGCRMDKSELHRLLDERFYDWALRDSQREIAQDFPFLRRVSGAINLRFLAIMKSLSLEERRQLASTLVRTNKVWIISNLPSRWTPEDDRIIAWYGERIRIQLREEWEGRLERHATYIRDKRELMRTVRDELMLVFPGESRKQSKKELHYHATVHGFDIETVVYSGSSTWQLWYFHRLRHPPSGLDVNHISLMGWLGITGPTYWWWITEATIPAAAKTVGDLCRHFLAAADDFLVGLVDRFGGA
jgi:hypothetical protein